jgi:hypothetical protein
MKTWKRLYEAAPVCWVCGAPFRAVRGDATWCGCRCRQIAHRLRRRLGRAPTRDEQALEWRLLQARHRARAEMKALVSQILRGPQWA